MELKRNVEKWLLIVGCPIDGFMYFGPFDTVNEAHDWREALHVGADYWIAQLNSPSTAETQDND
jgi:hypothetical protein